MITANSVRIGNWICHDEDRNLKVTLEDLRVMELDPSLYSGMAITAEILELAGFDFDGMSYDKGGIKLYYDSAKGFYYTSPHYTVRMEYVHELQNFFYCITKEELEIDLVDNSMLP